MYQFYYQSLNAHVTHIGKTLSLSMRTKEVVGLRAGETESLGNSETETSCIKNAYSEKKYVN